MLPTLALVLSLTAPAPAPEAVPEPEGPSISFTCATFEDHSTTAVLSITYPADHPFTFLDVYSTTDTADVRHYGAQLPEGRLDTYVRPSSDVLVTTGNAGLLREASYTAPACPAPAPAPVAPRAPEESTAHAPADDSPTYRYNGVPHNVR